MFRDEFEKILFSDDHRVYVNKSISPEATIRISGEVGFNMTGLSKEDIHQMDPVTIGIEV
ncbi:hypothetical protein [Methanolobus halotolerans]|uniref:Uncharacterized protein n=1 Tax=Methanolobus halotolerans TaxID=2052935 RepID=A0A4E0QD46_9EURY|nr:hypothetical protein [Methanolobus halotolerans]TGC11167.1 hypothetical protein CUN85_03235 [Methanolobus halotolerans]